MPARRITLIVTLLAMVAVLASILYIRKHPQTVRKQQVAYVAKPVVVERWPDKEFRRHQTEIKDEIKKDFGERWPVKNQDRVPQREQSSFNSVPESVEQPTKVVKTITFRASPKPRKVLKKKKHHPTVARVMRAKEKEFLGRDQVGG